MFGLAHGPITLAKTLCPAGKYSKLRRMVANWGVIWRLSRMARLFPEIVVPLFEQ
jgi:hypothetical protein